MAYTTIDDPEAYFQVKLYTGSGSIQAITLDGDTDMQPDFIWSKSKGETRHHYLADAVRGVKSRLRSDVNYAEYTAGSTDGYDSFDSDGFTLEEDASSLGLNESSHNMVALCWKANGSGSANTVGDINSTATSVNTTSGFSIVKWTANGSNDDTIGHGLGTIPKIVIYKRIDGAGTWYAVYTFVDTSQDYLILDTNAAKADLASGTYGTATSTTISNIGFTDTHTMLAYCFAPIQGFSKFGSYTGNGNNDGTFVYTGFRPAWVLVKISSSTGNWRWWDIKRETYNPLNTNLYPDTTDAEASNADRAVDFLSNGFKFRGTKSDVNASGITCIYMAFAEAPFVNSNGVPCNAR
jgi:hypothetical protein